MVSPRDDRSSTSTESTLLEQAQTTESKDAQARAEVLRESLAQASSHQHSLIALAEETRRRQEAESTLRDSEARYRLLYDHNPSMCFTLSPEGTVVSVNRFGATQLGYQPGELIGQSVLQVFKSEDHQTVLGQLIVCAATPLKVFQWEIQKIRKDGSILWVKERAQAVQDLTGEILVLVVCEDITERRLSEEQVRESEERWRALYEHAGVGIAQLGLNGQFLRVNHRLCEMLGYSSKTMLQRTFQELTHPDDLELNLRCLNELVAGKRPSFSMEKRYRRSDDVWIWVDVTVSLVRAASGAPDYFIAVIQHIDDRKQAEHRLRESERALKEQEALLRSVIETATDAIFMKDRHGRYRFINSSGAAVIGKSAADIVGKNDNELFPAETAGRLMADDREVFSGTSQRRFAEVISLNGEPHTFYSIKTPHRDQQGEIAGLVGVSRDMTEVKCAEEALRASELQLQRFVSETPVGLVIVDAERRPLSANKAFCALTGYTEEEVLNNTYALYTHPDDLPENLALTDEFFAGKRKSYTYEKRYIRKQGDIIWVSVKTTPIELPNHSGPLLLAVVQDITERKQATEAKERLSQDLHDNLLQSLYAVGMQLEAGKLVAARSTKQSKLHMTQAIEQLNDLVKDVRHFIAILKQNTTPAMNFRHALQRLVESFSTTDRATPELHIDQEAIALVTPEQAEQLLNIAREALSNSARHAHAAHQSVRLTKADDTITMRIYDDGIGFAMSRKRRRGHGLANMAARAKRIRARFTLESIQRKGTCITVELPLEGTHERA
jgi:PAS domain S-box-containing protein